MGRGASQAYRALGADETDHLEAGILRAVSHLSDGCAACVQLDGKTLREVGAPVSEVREAISEARRAGSVPTGAEFSRDDVSGFFSVYVSRGECRPSNLRARDCC